MLMDLKTGIKRFSKEVHFLHNIGTIKLYNQEDFPTICIEILANWPKLIINSILNNCYQMN